MIEFEQMMTAFYAAATAMREEDSAQIIEIEGTVTEDDGRESRFSILLQKTQNGDFQVILADSGDLEE